MIIPYIKADRRKEIMFEDSAPTCAGELNYAITMLLIEYWCEHHNYQGINDIVGALEGAKMEFTRRITIPYEKGKIKENGDVYD